MKKSFFIATIIVLLIYVGGSNLGHLSASPPPTSPFHRYEYATIRWAGRENTHVIRPGGRVEFAGPQLMSIKKPDRVDERSYYMNIVMNALAKEGYEFAGMTSDEIVLKRPAPASND